MKARGFAILVVLLMAVWQPSVAQLQGSNVEPNPSGASGLQMRAGAGLNGGSPPQTAAPPVNRGGGGRSVSSIFVDDNAQLTLTGPANPSTAGASPAFNLGGGGGGGGSSKLSIVVDDDARLTLPASALGSFPSQQEPALTPDASQSQNQGPLGSANQNNGAFANHGQGSAGPIGDGNFGGSLGNTGQPSGGGLLGTLISLLAGESQTLPNILGSLGLGNSFGQMASSPAGNSFGQMPSSPAGNSFGQMASSPAGNSFGQVPSSPAGNSFGQMASSPAGNSFGQMASSPAGNSFGQVPSSPAGNSFGQMASSPAGNSFGQMASSPAGNSFGQMASSPAGNSNGQMASSPSGKSFGQMASSPAGSAGGPNLGFIGREIQYQGQEKMRSAVRGIQEAGNIAGQVGHTAYRGALRKKNILNNLAKETVGNVGTFADEAVVASFDKVSGSANAFLRLFRDLKGAFLNALIAKSQAKRRLVNAQTETKSAAVDGILSEKREVLRGKIRAVTGLSSNQ